MYSTEEYYRDKTFKISLQYLSVTDKQMKWLSFYEAELVNKYNSFAKYVRLDTGGSCHV